MADVFSKKKRSEIMSKVKGRGNASTELRLIKLFRKKRIKGWRRNHRVVGKPDFVFPARRLAVFVDGCFWHGCSLHRSLPKQNQAFWIQKLERNRNRDRVVRAELRKAGWGILRIWEHEFRNEAKLTRRVTRSLVDRI